MTRSDPHAVGFFSKESWPTNERTYMEDRLAFPTSHSHVQPQSISTMLRDKCHLPVKEFVLVTLYDNGTIQTFTSPSLHIENDGKAAASLKSTFTHMLRRADPEGAFALAIHSSYDESSESCRGVHKNPRFDDNGGETSGSTKRARRRHGGRSRETASDEMLIPIPSRKTQTLQIGNSAQVEEFYKTRFKDMQQTACKTIGKAFVKLVEPKKQTHHPYTKGDESAPPWWPSSVDAEHRVRHKEPDHLYKKERIILLVHILRMIVRPFAQQHPSVQKAGLNIQKLDEFTTETMGTWFGDNDHPENRKKKAFLREIFKVAKLEERFLRDEIDGTTNIPVAFGDRSMIEADESEDEGLAFDTPPGSAHGEHEHMVAGIPTPESIPIVSPGMTHHEVSASDPRMRQLPHRYNTHSMEAQTNFGEQPYFPRQNMDAFQQSPTIPEPIRQRTFTSEDYHPTHSGLGWQQQTMVNPGPSTTPYYGHSSSSAPLFQVGNTLPPPPSMVVSNSGAHFDGLPALAGRYSSNGPIPGTQFRTGSLGHPHQMQPQGFEGYLQDNDGQFGQQMKEEQQQHHPHQNQHHHMHSQ